MKKIVQIGAFCAVAMALICQTCFATTMISPTSFSEMMLMSDVVFYGEVLSTTRNNAGYMDYTFDVRETYKGTAEGNFVVTGYSTQLGNEVYLVNGDVDYAVGSVYLVFLFQAGDDAYRSTMFANSVYEEIVIDGDILMNQPEAYKNLCFLENDESYVRGPFLQTALLNHMSLLLDDPEYLGDLFSVKQIAPAVLNQASQTKALCPQPAHCTNLTGSFNLNQSCTTNSPAKFEDPTFLVSITANSPTDPSNPNAISDISNAVGTMDDVFCGVDISMDSPIVQNCTVSCFGGGSSASSCNNSSENNIRVSLDDPCNEIASMLSPPFCSGTLALGGAGFTFFNCHTDNCGDQWNSSINPEVVVNDNAGCSGNNAVYSSVLLHEMLHSLYLGHIAGQCTAVMNPFICGSNASVDFGIRDLDTECVDWMYAPTPDCGSDGGGGGGGGSNTIVANLEAALQGPMQSSGIMSTAIRDAGLLPNAQPYNESPYNYEGTETVSSFPADVVDWVLVELRTVADVGQVAARRACFLRNDGAVVDLDGSEGVGFNAAAGNYFVSINHRTHLGVVSANPIPIPNTSTLSFTDSFSSVMGSSQLANAGGTATLKTGDYDGSGTINFGDFIRWLTNNNTLNTYQAAEGNLDGTINFSDFIRWLGNNNSLGVSAIQN